MSIIEYIACEWAWLRSESDRQCCKDETVKLIPPPVFDVDGVIERYRNFETAITHFRPRNPREAAIFSEVVTERIHITETDHNLDAPLEESGRAAFALRDYLCAQAERDSASLRAELLSLRNTNDAKRPTLIEALCAELAAAWKMHADLDHAVISNRSGNVESLQKEMDAKTTMLRDLEAAIASARIQSRSDLEVVLMLFANDLQDTWSDRIQQDMRFNLWCETIREYQARSEPSWSHEILRHYIPKAQPKSQPVRDAAE